MPTLRQSKQLRDFSQLSPAYHAHESPSVETLVGTVTSTLELELELPLLLDQEDMASGDCSLAVRHCSSSRKWSRGASFNIGRT
jgi:hypothetical protein